ncbi:MAG: crossover junction endodeoxyribonuclease RuvC [Candidatus Kerfeldbacteria bacterium CG_4_10_14_0_8_um_filter_42_10]|uniref:Crossover junction endodeoxyribonuclease RuvC n=1 Tax=Candidatus Kerfeldbacteria bacterium CG_4_10_14_0_8_um_filter_42_10 TaxID=2014248 RepID=A0A2M7RJE6_9BACT|nr:MAG: crossover junction endodeoxyribonuclease RuvC [Candidatus Kerfeldbacteria bacterium CG_4_10_14_0_8_um_filter_42_10]
MKNSKEQLVLGIDPGVASVGWAIVQGKNDSVSFQKAGCIQTSKHGSFGKRVALIYRALNAIIKKYHPDVVAVEQLFFYKNVKTAIVVSQARGVILLAAEQAGLPITEFTPLEVKQAICGYGRAEKQQIQKMIKVLLRLKSIPQSDDAADALAIAVCSLITKEF